MDQNYMNNQEAVKEQYSNGKNLNTRISLHTKYSTNKLGFNHWVYNQYQFSNQCRILELGCGSGDIWTDKLEKLNENCSLVLSDFSAGMVEEVKSKFSGYSNVSFEQIDIENIPYGDEAFDFVVANMMLYHVPDINKALNEVNRVLKKNGVFYCATFGENGTNKYLMSALAEYGVNKDINGSFSLQNGTNILKNQFDDVTKLEYVDALEITDTNDLLDYLYSLSTIGNIVNINRNELFEFFEKKKDSNGIIHIPKEYGMFISIKA
ncbi:MAG: class I SAM-dependent methyltransferase [Mobilitalea sp.]